MEKIGEKHAFLEKRKCGSRKVLRFMRSLLYVLTVLSLPMRGAWIEIIVYPSVSASFSMSLPMRGAWIEIMYVNVPDLNFRVAPHAGSVD